MHTEYLGWNEIDVSHAKRDERWRNSPEYIPDSSTVNKQKPSQSQYEREKKSIAMKRLQEYVLWYM